MIWGPPSKIQKKLEKNTKPVLEKSNIWGWMCVVSTPFAEEPDNVPFLRSSLKGRLR